MPTSSPAYREDLTHIHNAGFGMIAENAAAELLRLLRKQKRAGGRVIDLGCGGGILAAALSQAGYDVLGYDLSPSMVEQARRRAPAAEFRVGSFLDAELPRAVAVTAVGEIFCYLFDRRNAARALAPLLRRIHRALQPGGVLLFDVATPGRVPPGGTRNFREGDDWVCTFAADEDAKRRRLTRRITTFRRAAGDNAWRRDDETHVLRLHDPAEVAAELKRLGFRVRRLGRYGEFEFPKGLVGFAATKGKAS